MPDGVVTQVISAAGGQTTYREHLHRLLREEPHPQFMPKPPDPETDSNPWPTRRDYRPPILLDPITVCQRCGDSVPPQVSWWCATCRELITYLQIYRGLSMVGIAWSGEYEPRRGDILESAPQKIRDTALEWKGAIDSLTAELDSVSEMVRLFRRGERIHVAGMRRRLHKTRSARRDQKDGRVHLCNFVEKVRESFGAEPVHIREVAGRLGLPVGTAAVYLSQLARRGKFERISRGTYRVAAEGTHGR